MKNEDWPLLLSLFPQNWKELAFKTNVVKGLRKNKNLEDYLRTLLIHLGCGYSLRETVARAKLANIADLSDVALMERLRKAKDWLQSLCISLFEEQGIDVISNNEFQVRLFDATNVREPGKTGSLWRIHYSMRLPSLTCDFFKLTSTKGKGTGESFFQYSIKKDDYIIADRAYATPSGICHVASKQAYVLVRVNTKSLPRFKVGIKPLPLLEKLSAITQTNAVASWKVRVTSNSDQTVPGRICVIRKSDEAIKLAHKRIKKEAIKHKTKVQPETYEYAKFVIIFTTFPESQFSDIDVLNWYRNRWQIELAFKRFKSIAQLGHIPKHDDDSSKAWLYGKLFVALLTEKLIRYASFFSPWGYELEEKKDSKQMARVQLCI